MWVKQWYYPMIMFMTLFYPHFLAPIARWPRKPNARHKERASCCEFHSLGTNDLWRVDHPKLGAVDDVELFIIGLV